MDNVVDANMFSFLLQIDLLSIIFFVLGFIFLIVEIFLPGFGAPGIAGTILLLVGVLYTAKSVYEALIIIGIIIIVLMAAVFIAIKSASKGRLSRVLVLKDTLAKAKGFSSNEDLSELIGAEGVAVTTLRPAGTAEIKGEKVDVVSESEFIEAGARVKVILTEGRRIVVKKV